MNRLRVLYAKFGETIRYLIAGAATTAVNFLIFAALTRLLHISDNISNPIAISAALLFAFFVNKLFVFHMRSWGRTALVEFTKFLPARLFALVVEVAGYELFVSLIGHDLAAKALIQIVVIILNYILGKLVVFRKVD